MTDEHRSLACRALASISAYDSARTLIDAGVYAAGSNHETDTAIRQRPALEAFIRQTDGRPERPEATLAALAAALEN